MNIHSKYKNEMIKQGFDASKRFKDTINEEGSKQTPRFDNVMNRTYEKARFNKVNSSNVCFYFMIKFIVFTNKEVQKTKIISQEFDFKPKRY